MERRSRTRKKVYGKDTSNRIGKVPKPHWITIREQGILPPGSRPSGQSFTIAALRPSRIGQLIDSKLIVSQRIALAQA
jgi:hypothetical protein